MTTPQTVHETVSSYWEALSPYQCDTLLRRSEKRRNIIAIQMHTLSRSALNALYSWVQPQFNALDTRFGLFCVNAVLCLLDSWQERAYSSICTCQYSFRLCVSVQLKYTYTYTAQHQCVCTLHSTQSHWYTTIATTCTLDTSVADAAITYHQC